MRWSSFGSEGTADRVTSGWVPLRPAQKQRRVQDIRMPSALGPMFEEEAQEAGVPRRRHEAVMHLQRQPQSTLGEFLCWTHYARLSHLELFLFMSTSHWMGTTQGGIWPLQLSNPRRGQQAEAVFPLRSQQLDQQMSFLKRGLRSTSHCPLQETREGALWG